MGCLEHRADPSRRQFLAAETVVGRSRRADLRIDEGYVSSLHASLQWRGRQWALRDLGSRNGTTVNGEVLKGAELRPLEAGDELGFGDPDETWRLVDADEPQPIGRGPQGQQVAGQEGLLALPSPESALATIYQDAEGHWRCEGADSTQRVEDLEAVVVGEESWTLCLPAAVDATRAATALRLSQVEFVLKGVNDERAAAVHVRGAGPEFSFFVGSSGRVLAALVRARKAGEGEGWLAREGLLGALTIRGTHLNVAVYRLRRQFAAAGFVDAPSLIERDRGRLRVAITNIELEET